MNEVLAHAAARLEQVVDRRAHERDARAVLEPVRDQLGRASRASTRVAPADVLDQMVERAVRRLVVGGEEELAAGARVVLAARAVPAGRGRLGRRLRGDLALGRDRRRSCSPGTLKSITSVPK